MKKDFKAYILASICLHYIMVGGAFEHDDFCVIPYLSIEL